MKYLQVTLLSMTFLLTGSQSVRAEDSSSKESQYVGVPVKPNGKIFKAIRRTKPNLNRSRILNINFAHQPEQGSAKGVVGKKSDHWNFADFGQRKIRNVALADGSATDVEIEVSENDGEWGIAEQTGIFHGYIYHNCRCVDLSVTVKYLPAGIYETYVFAHGDAPDQNAAIEINSNGVKLTGKSTLNDETWNFRSEDYKEGNQYVRYLVEVSEGSPVTITSKRDGSVYSMFNAIQFKKIN